MKIKGILIVMMLSVAGLGARCQESPVITQIEFISLTRGYQKQVFFSADSVIRLINDRGENKEMKRKLDPFEWEELLKTASQLKLAEVPSLPSPTSRRAFDGARHSTLVISTKDGQSYTHSFDDENPHDHLRDLMEVVKKIAGEDPQQ